MVENMFFKESDIERLKANHRRILALLVKSLTIWILLNCGFPCRRYCHCRIRFDVATLLYLRDAGEAVDSQAWKTC